ncbi:MAG: DUF1906 domain-containing protein [Oscillospiraceae bacterium]|nr:DUF1906 domain-containing protein [Oscillospiraceae bacterium]
MHSVKGIDTATPLTAATASAVKAAGYAFAGRYLVPASGTLKWKALTAPEAKRISDAGLRLLTVWETSADRVLGGATAGAADGAQAYTCAKAIDMPTDGIIYFAVDYEATDAQMDTIAAYLQAARAQTEEYEIGVYGSYRVVEAMAARGVCKGFWQCLAWSYGQRSDALTVYQGEFNRTVGGVSVDIDDCPDMDAAGIWDYTSKNSIEEDDIMTGEEIYNALNEYLVDMDAPDWAQDELQEAIDMGITDGTRPMQLIPRYQAAIMAKRAAEAAAKS